VGPARPAAEVVIEAFRGGGRLAGMVDVPVVVPCDATPRMQETHITVVYLICALVDEVLFAQGEGA
jgi:D-sedoheptulose 7-phosphate isomerase